MERSLVAIDQDPSDRNPTHWKTSHWSAHMYELLRARSPEVSNLPETNHAQLRCRGGRGKRDEDMPLNRPKTLRSRLRSQILRTTRLERGVCSCSELQSTLEHDLEDLSS